MAGTVVVLDISAEPAGLDRMQLLSLVFQWLQQLSQQSPLERIAIASTYEVLESTAAPRSRAKAEPGVKQELVKTEGNTRPAKRKRAEAKTEPG